MPTGRHAPQARMKRVGKAQSDGCGLNGTRLNQLLWRQSREPSKFFLAFEARELGVGKAMSSPVLKSQLDPASLLPARAVQDLATEEASNVRVVALFLPPSLVHGNV